MKIRIESLDKKQRRTQQLQQRMVQLGRALSDKNSYWEHLALISLPRYIPESYRLPSNWEELREQRFNMDNGVCQLCGQLIIGIYHTDHIIPRSQGGTHELSNLRTTCPLCHAARHPGNARLLAMAKSQTPSDYRGPVRFNVKYNVKDFKR